MCGPLTKVLGWTLNKAKQLQLFKVVPHLKIAEVFSIGNKRHVQGLEQSTCDVQTPRGKSVLTSLEFWKHRPIHNLIIPKDKKINEVLFSSER